LSIGERESSHFDSSVGKRGDYVVRVRPDPGGEGRAARKKARGNCNVRKVGPEHAATRSGEKKKGKEVKGRRGKMEKPC